MKGRVSPYTGHKKLYEMHTINLSTTATHCKLMWQALRLSILEHLNRGWRYMFPTSSLQLKLLEFKLKIKVFARHETHLRR